MARPAHVVIVGGGVVGASTAYALAKREIAVTLIEAREAAGLETSYANGSILTPSMPDPWNGPGVFGHLFSSLFNPSSAMLLRPSQIPALASWGMRFLANSRAPSFEATTRANFTLAHYSVQTTRAWIEREGLVFDHADAPTIKFFRSDAAMHTPLRLAEMLAPLGLRFDRLSAEETVALEPALAAIARNIAGGLAYPDDMRGDAYRFTGAILDRAVTRGATVRTGTKVEGLERDHGKVVGVRIGHETLRADAVVIAAANASRGLVAPLGLRLPVRPAKGYSLTFEMTGLNDRPTHPVVDDAMHAAVVPVGDRLRVAGTAEFAGESRSLDARRVAGLEALLRAVYPDIATRLEPERGVAWTGLRPMSADGRPFIGATRIPGLWLNTGHGHLGWTKAAGSAELLAGAMLGASPAVDPAPFAASRV